MLSVNLMLNIMINTWYLLISRDLSRASKLGLYFHSNGSLKGPYFVSKWVSIGSLFFSKKSLKLIGHPEYHYVGWTHIPNAILQLLYRIKTY